MNKHAPKSEFLKARAASLHQSGYTPADVARMLHVSNDTAYSWLSERYQKRKHIRLAVHRAERDVTKLDPVSPLPTLAYVPHIKLTPISKYTMRSA